MTELKAKGCGFLPVGNETLPSLTRWKENPHCHFKQQSEQGKKPRGLLGTTWFKGEKKGEGGKKSRKKTPTEKERKKRGMGKKKGKERQDDVKRDDSSGTSYKGSTHGLRGRGKSL